MAELDTSGGGKKGGKKVRSKKQSTRVDLTAMVDLAFLLITFFILTTTLQKPKAMDLVMPDKDEEKDVKLDIPETRTVNVILGSNNKIWWYVGRPANIITTPETVGFGKNGIRASLMKKGEEIKAASGKPMIVLVKPSDKSTYENLVTMMDELDILKVEQRAIVDIEKAELDAVKAAGLYQ